MSLVLLAGLVLCGQTPSEPPLVKGEKTILSANGAFRLKISPCDMVKHNDGFALTFFAKVEKSETAPDGWKKLWDRSNYVADDADFVTDSGRVVEFLLMTAPAINQGDGSKPPTTSIEDLGSMYVWDTDGNEMAGIDLSVFGFTTLAEIRRSIKMAKTTTVSNSMTTRTCQGLELPFSTEESITLLFKDGSKQSYQIIFNDYMNSWCLHEDEINSHLKVTAKQPTRALP